jgi:hypothetical protein
MAILAAVLQYKHIKLNILQANSLQEPNLLSHRDYKGERLK